MTTNRTCRHGRPALAWSLLAVATGVALGQSAVSESTFSAGSWTATTEQGGLGGTATLTQQSDDGNPGPSAEVFLQLNGTNPAARVVLIAILRGQAWDPSQDGAIDSLSFGQDASFEAGDGDRPHQGGGPVVQQGGVTYFYRPGGAAAFTVTDSAWRTFSQTSLAADSFASGVGTQPDFSTSGAALSFGFYRELSASGDTTTEETSQSIAGIDNFFVEISAAVDGGGSGDGSNEPSHADDPNLASTDPNESGVDPNDAANNDPNGGTGAGPDSTSVREGGLGLPAGSGSSFNSSSGGVSGTTSGICGLVGFVALSLSALGLRRSVAGCRRRA